MVRTGSRPARLPVRRAMWAAAALVLAACDEGLLGPRPSERGLDRERVVVRSAEPLPGVQVREYLLDRLRFLDAGDPHHVDRVIRGQGLLPWPRLDSLGIAVGDTLLVTTRFERADRVYGLTAPIPDWPGHDARSYLLGTHTVTEVEKAGRRTAAGE
ncbi:MAG TPA: hypothetical protein VK420_10180 [Longimicrobium sp.]|nr:hypothetical protein [Longimicrobium sp.]